MADAATLVADNPRTTFVLIHAGMLVDREEETVRRWRAGMRRLAELPNVVVKLTGQGTFVHRLDPDLLRLTVDEVMQLFGPQRALFGTNFPVEKLWTTMPLLVEAWKDALSGLSLADQTAVFAGNTRRVYGLNP